MLLWIWSKIAALIIMFVVTHAPQPTVVMKVPTVIATQVVVQPMSQLGTLDSWITMSNWPQWTWSTVRRIVLCESGGQPGIVSRSGHVGLMQVDPRYWGYPPSDPVGQLNQGYQVYLKQGWYAWSCF